MEKFSDIAHHHIRKGDVLGRYGGEEFVFIFEGIDEAQSFRILNRIHMELTKYFAKQITFYMRQKNWGYPERRAVRENGFLQNKEIDYY